MGKSAPKAKSHRKQKAGRKAEKRKDAEQKKAGRSAEEIRASKAQAKEHRAFGFTGTAAAFASARAKRAERDQRRMHNPVVAREVDEPPPFVVLVHGPPGVGKSTLIRAIARAIPRHRINHFGYCPLHFKSNCAYSSF